MFSGRLGSLETSELWQRLVQKRAAGDEILDLTESNPTRDAEAYSGEELLAALAHPGALTYEPSPRGHPLARDAIASYYRERGRRVSPDDIVLTASTSEAYSFSFKLLCDPGDRILVPRPSYPLFESLAELEAVEPIPYSVEHGPDETPPSRCRAILAVHPNNPTGTHVTDTMRERLIATSEGHELAVVVDEVFLDYPLRRERAPSFAGGERGLVLTLSGLSKLAGLPQMKLAWIVLGGTRERVEEARHRLEHIADAYLSVGTPVQLAAPRFLELGQRVRARILERLETNLAFLEKAVARVPAVTLATPEGGWYASLRLPAIASADEWALDFLESASVYLHPGSLFGFESPSYVVASLLSQPEVFRVATDRVLGVVSDRVDSPGA